MTKRWKGWRDVRRPTSWPCNGQICWVWCHLDNEPRIARYDGDESFYDATVYQNSFVQNFLPGVEFWMPVEEGPPPRCPEMEMFCK